MANGLPMETRLGYLTAWRTWRVWASGDAPVLHSVAAAPAMGVWPPLQAMEARCSYREMRPPACQCDSCPGDDNPCGIYAYRVAPQAARHAMGIVGQVALWGTVIEHSDGYRGQYAYPLSCVYAHCGWCADAGQAALLPLAEMSVLTPQRGAGWAVWTCAGHVQRALAQARALETGKVSSEWAPQDGVAFARAIADAYAMTVAAP